VKSLSSAFSVVWPRSSRLARLIFLYFFFFVYAATEIFSMNKVDYYKMNLASTHDFWRLQLQKLVAG